MTALYNGMILTNILHFEKKSTHDFWQNVWFYDTFLNVKKKKIFGQKACYGQLDKDNQTIFFWPYSSIYHVTSDLPFFI